MSLGYRSNTEFVYEHWCMWPQLVTDDELLQPGVIVQRRNGPPVCLAFSAPAALQTFLFLPVSCLITNAHHVDRIFPFSQSVLLFSIIFLDMNSCLLNFLTLHRTVASTSLYNQQAPTPIKSICSQIIMFLSYALIEERVERSRGLPQLGALRCI